MACASSSAPARVHVWLIMMENKSDSQIVDNPAAPYINSLIRRYAFASNYYGVAHPSLPNYVATIAGSTFGSHSDNPSQRFTGKTIVGQLASHHLTWKAYMESMPKVGFTGNFASILGVPLYARKHDPFMLMTSILGSASKREHVVPGSQIYADLRTGRSPNFSYVVPNLCHDMHGTDVLSTGCPTSESGLIGEGNRYLSDLIPKILHSSSWTSGSAVFIIWDEGVGSGRSVFGYYGGLVPAIIISKNRSGHVVSSTLYDHYSLLKTVEQMWHLPCLRASCESSVHSMTSLLK